ncbi:MAG TPA: hypothetical protein PKE62_03105 [Anaerolineales bacterium]|nr:hypothetical protein [Anaerolineales bacterium]
MDEKIEATVSPEPAKTGSNRSVTIAAAIAGASFALCVCAPILVIAVMRLLGPKIGNTFSTINSSLP